MKVRRWAAVTGAGVVVVTAIALWALPGLVRHLAITRLEAMTGRPAAIDSVQLSVWRGAFSARGLTLAERDGRSPFVSIARIDGRLHLPSLVAGHVRLRELVVSDPSVRIVRLAVNEYNLSDLQRRSGTPPKAFDVTVERFQVRHGRAVLEDRALPDARTWTSEDITIDAHDVSTRRDDGRATGSSVTAGARTSFELRRLRLHPVALEGTVNVEGFDLTLAQVYLPPHAPVRIERGRISSTIGITLDAQDGIRADAAARVIDVVLARADDGRAVGRIPEITTRVTGFGLGDSGLRVERLALDGHIEVRDPTARADRFRPSGVHASVRDLTWPATQPGRLDVQASIPGGGTLALTGTIQAPPAASDLRLRIARADLAPWAQFFPGALRVSGSVDGDLRLNDTLAAGLATRVNGSVTAAGLRVADAGQEIGRVQRATASGLEMQWPASLHVGRVEIVGPRATVLREASGSLRHPFARRVERGDAATAEATPRRSNATMRVSVGEIAVRDGALAWHDASTKPAAKLALTALDMRIAGASWPPGAPLDVRGRLRAPGGGQVSVVGRIGMEQLDAELRVRAANVALSPYQPYLPTTARLSGAADVDLAIVTPSLRAGRAHAQGTAALFRLDVRDGERTVVRTERAAVTGLDVEWPERVAAARVALSRPWMLLERDETGALALRALMPTRATTDPSPGATPEGAGGAPTIRIDRLTVDGGGLRVVDRAIRPAFAVDLDRATARVEGLATGAARPARLEVTARVGATADLALRGTLGPLDGPLNLHVDGTLHEFAVPRMNSYLARQVGWSSRAGALTTTLRGRIDGDALAAKTDITIQGLRLVRAAEHDEAQSRIGLPLGMITALMKNRRGEINLSFPVGGRLADPKFDVRETLWSAVRTVAINAITLPVSWIGRVEFTRDSKIQQIHVDPLPFEPGTATPTAAARAHAGRLKAFMDELAEVRLQLTPLVSAHDVAEVKRRRVLAAVDDLARAEGLTRDAAIRRLYEQRLKQRAEGDRPESILAALVEREESGDAVAELAERRLDAARATLKEAGVDTERLMTSRRVDTHGADGRVTLDLVEPGTERTSKIRDALKKLGVPWAKDDATN